MQHRHVLYILAMACTAACGMAAQLFSGYIPRIAASLLPGVDAGDAIRLIGSYGGSAFLLGWAVGAFALGWVSDKIGRRYAYFISVLLATSAMLFVSFADTFFMLICARVMMGVGVGSVLAQSVVMISEAFPTSSRPIVVGILINAFPMGFILAGLITQSTDDWQAGYRIASAAMFLAIAALVIVRESDMWSARMLAATQENHNVWHRSYRRDLVVAIVLFGSMLLGIWAVLAWMPTYVAKMSMPEHSQTNRSLANIMFGAGNVVGGLLSGVLSNRLGRRKAAAIGYVGCLTTTVLTLQTGLAPSFTFFAGAFIICVFIGLNQGILSGYLPELFPTIVRGTRTGLSMNMGRVLTATGVFFLGVLVEHLGGYHNAITLFAGAYVIGLITLIWARETRGQDLPR